MINEKTVFILGAGGNFKRNRQPVSSSLDFE
jgi:hypothetical protein